MIYYIKDYVEGVFIISASSKDVFLNRLSKIERDTQFSTGGFDSYENDKESGTWKVITTGYYEDVDDLKGAMNMLKEYEWLFDQYLLLNGKEIYSVGKWILK